MQTMPLPAKLEPKLVPDLARFTPPIVVVVALLILGGLFANNDSLLHGSSSHSSSNLVDGAYIVPGTANNGTLQINIPPGTADRMRAGETGYLLPNVIQLRVGDSIVITNNDFLPHMMLFTFIEPGETIVRTFDRVTMETYSAGCTMDPTPSGFTSLFVSE